MSGTQTNDVNIVIRITNIDVKNLEILQPDVKKAPHEFNFTVSINHDIELPKNTMSVTVSTLIHGATKDDRMAQLDLRISYEFSDTTHIFIANTKQKTLEMNAQVMLMLYSTSLSTTRGALFASLKGTGLEHAYLPIIDAAQFLPAAPSA